MRTRYWQPRLNNTITTTTTIIIRMIITTTTITIVIFITIVIIIPTIIITTTVTNSEITATNTNAAYASACISAEACGDPKDIGDECQPKVIVKRANIDSW